MTSPVHFARIAAATSGSENTCDTRGRTRPAAAQLQTWSNRAVLDDGSFAIEIAAGQPRTSSPFIRIRLVGRTLAFGAPRRPPPSATSGVAAQPTIRYRAPNLTHRSDSTESGPPTPSYTRSTPRPPVSALTWSRRPPGSVSGPRAIV